MTRRAIFSAGFTLLLVAGSVLPASADLVMRKLVVRHFPEGEGSCPFVNELELSFIASGPEAILTLTAEGVDFEPIEIDTLIVVDREKFVSRFNNPLGESCMGGGLAYYAGDSSDVILSEDPNGWSFTNADLEDSVIRMGITGETEARASVRVRGLVPGHEYFVTGRSDSGGFGVEVDCPLPPEFSLANGRFRVEVRWDVNERLVGVLTHSEKTVGLWFQDPKHLVMMVSAVDNCGTSGNGTYWLMFAGTTANKLRISVQDTVTGIQKTYRNGSQIRLKTVVDKTTFRCRP